MNRLEIKKLIISSLSADTDPREFAGKLEEAGISFDFRKGFVDKILERISSTQFILKSEVDFVKSMNFAFSRIALTGVAAIVLLLISIFLMEGSLSFNSFLGLGDSYDESIVCLLTGN